MLKPQEEAASHVDLFIERYERLFLWSLQLTENDQQQAEDLLHDAFIQFTLGQADLNSIQNLEGYLRTVLRNIHVSQVRRSARSPIRSLSIVEYDSVELGLRVIDPRTQMNVQDELRTVCQYACARKESSKAGSILILRFFHGYYPDEISKVSRISRPAVKDRLRLARAEAKLYLDSPKALSFMQQNQETRTNPAEVGRRSGDFLSELRRTIFDSRNGDCLTKEELHALYNSEASEALDCARLAHIASCQQCLDEVSTLLNLLPLSSRSPAETAGKDQPRRKGGPGGMGPRGGAGMSSVSGYLRRAKEVFEHEPQELFISVNGYILGSQKISSELMEQTLSLKGEENIGFVEVFSEQEIRLLLLNVEPLPDGSVKQSARVRLGEGRTLDVSLSFSGAWPTLYVIYRDPRLAQEATEIGEEAPATSPSSTNTQKPRRTTIGESFKRITAALGGSLTNWTVWLRPSTVTAIFAVILIAVLLLVQFRKPVSTEYAADLLRRSADAEEMTDTRTDQVLHRTINLEVRNSAGELIASRKIEEWHSGQKGLTARRLYSEKGDLLAGDWRRRDGAETIYNHGKSPQLRLVPEKRGLAPLSSDDVWHLSPSATEFAQLIGKSQNARVEKLSSTYLISYERNEGAGGNGLVRAWLVLSKADLHATELTLFVRAQNSDLTSAPQGPAPIVEYRFVEASFERHSPSTVVPAVFEPDQELLASAKAESRNAQPETIASASSLQPPTPVMASAALEVEVLRALNGVGADMGEQVSVTRTPEGLLRIQGIVETDQRKSEILGALNTVAGNPSVRVDIKTVAEAVRQAKTPNSSSPASVQRVETGGSAMPVQSELRRYFSGKGVLESQLDERSSQFAYRMVGESSQALQHAWALRRLGERFSPEELRALDPEARGKWIGLIRQHAQALRRNLVTLREGFSPIFPGAALSQSSRGAPEINSDTDLERAIGRLFELCTASDTEIRSALSVSPDTTKAVAIKASQFWLSFRSAEDLAARISDVRF